MKLSPDQKRIFDEKGFIIIKNLIKKNDLNKIKKKINNIFNLKYDTKIHPDKIKWRNSDKNKKIIRSQCNLWKSDLSIAKIAMSKKIGEVAAGLMQWNGTRLNQDSLIWVLPKTGGVSYHQDNPYQDWHTPGKIITAWAPLDDTSENGATLEYAVGSHKWGNGKRLKSFFSKNHKKIFLSKFKRKKIIFEKIILKKGDVAFHHGDIWHGSGKNNSNKQRISLSLHLMSKDSKFHKSVVNPVFNHYKKFNSLLMDESFFPIIWSKSGQRSSFIKNYIK